jgi:energy-coupling factor transporter ATP-binding protein EcfA2
MLVAGQKQQLLWDLPPSETFELNRALYGIDRATFKRSLDELVHVLQLEPLLQKPVRQLSLGERMKCELAAALLHRPRVLFLDEPTIGLDVTMQTAVREFIRRYNEEQGATVILTSHYMADVAALCPRVIVIDLRARPLDRCHRRCSDLCVGARARARGAAFLEHGGRCRAVSERLVDLVCAVDLGHSFGVPRRENRQHELPIRELVRSCALAVERVSRRVVGAVYVHHPARADDHLPSLGAARARGFFIFCALARRSSTAAVAVAVRVATLDTALYGREQLT